MRSPFFPRSPLARGFLPASPVLVPFCIFFPASGPHPQISRSPVFPIHSHPFASWTPLYCSSRSHPFSAGRKRSLSPLSVCFFLLLLRNFPSFLRVCASSGRDTNLLRSCWPKGFSSFRWWSRVPTSYRPPRFFFLLALSFTPQFLESAAIARSKSFQDSFFAFSSPGLHLPTKAFSLTLDHPKAHPSLE